MAIIVDEKEIMTKYGSPALQGAINQIDQQEARVGAKTVSNEQSGSEAVEELRSTTALSSANVKATEAE